MSCYTCLSLFDPENPKETIPLSTSLTSISKESYIRFCHYIVCKNRNLIRCTIVFANDLQFFRLSVTLHIIQYLSYFNSFDLRIEEQRSTVHNMEDHGLSDDDCGKGNLPKRKETHVPDAGSVIE